MRAHRFPHPALAALRLAAPPAIALAAAVAGPAGCTGRSGDGPSGPAALLEESRRLWESSSIADYSFRYQQVCFCLPDYVRPVRLVVREGELVEAQFVDGEGPQPADPANYPTMDALFERLEQALAQGPEAFDVSYDPELGYPTSARVDISAQIADEEFSFTASDLTPAGTGATPPE